MKKKVIKLYANNYANKKFFLSFNFIIYKIKYKKKIQKYIK